MGSEQSSANDLAACVEWAKQRRANCDAAAAATLLAPGAADDDSAVSPLMVLRSTAVGRDVRVIELSFPGRLPLEPGGHLALYAANDFPEAQNAAVSPAEALKQRQRFVFDAARRPYTPFAIHDGSFVVAVRAYKGGSVSPFLAALRPGDTVLAGAPQAPAARPVADLRRCTARDGALLLVGGGTGIAPLLSIARAVLEEDNNGAAATAAAASAAASAAESAAASVVIVACFRDAADATLLRDELHALAARHAAARVVYVYSREPASAATAASIGAGPVEEAVAPRVTVLRGRSGDKNGGRLGEAHCAWLRQPHVAPKLASPAAAEAAAALVCGPMSFGFAVAGMLVGQFPATLSMDRIDVL